jgi:hypothetical protein
MRTPQRKAICSRTHCALPKLLQMSSAAAEHSSMADVLPSLAAEGVQLELRDSVAAAADLLRISAAAAAAAGQSRAWMRASAPLCIAATHTLRCSCVLCMLLCRCSACACLCWSAERLGWQRNLPRLQAALIQLQREAAQEELWTCVSRMLYVTASLAEGAASNGFCHR